MSDATRDTGNGILPGIPSDDAPAILATGRSDITTLFLSMARKHPGGADADYLRWHTLDHRPEQQRLASLRTSLRVVSTPQCRAARAASSADFDAIDHVMIYFFNSIQGLDDFHALSIALRDAGRSPFILKPVQRGVYGVDSRMAAARARIGADVLPWLPVRGVYILLELGHASTDTLAETAGVSGVWTAHSVPTAFSNAEPGQQLTVCFLDKDPVTTGLNLRTTLDRRWSSSDVQPLLAAPFHTVVPFEWERHLP